jgi:hypothetical protein
LYVQYEATEAGSRSPTKIISLTPLVAKSPEAKVENEAFTLLSLMQLAGLALASVASMVIAESAQLATSNTSTPPTDPANLVGSNSSHAGHIVWTVCRLPRNAVGQWWYNARSYGPHFYYGLNDDPPWSMLNAYRSGGTINVHWKYTDDPLDIECLTNWKYYGEDGNQLIAQVSGSLTRDRDTRSWCALPVYRSGGVEGNQWGWCICVE